MDHVRGILVGVEPLPHWVLHRGPFTEGGDPKGGSRESKVTCVLVFRRNSRIVWHLQSTPLHQKLLHFFQDMLLETGIALAEHFRFQPSHCLTFPVLQTLSSPQLGASIGSLSTSAFSSSTLQPASERDDADMRHRCELVSHSECLSQFDYTSLEKQKMLLHWQIDFALFQCARGHECVCVFAWTK